MIQPVVAQQLVLILVRDCGMRGVEAAKMSHAIINGLGSDGFEIIKGNWIDGPVERVEKPKEMSKWDKLALDAAEWINGPASPLNRSELR